MRPFARAPAELRTFSAVELAESTGGFSPLFLIGEGMLRHSKKKRTLSCTAGMNESKLCHRMRPCRWIRQGISCHGQPHSSGHQSMFLLPPFTWHSDPVHVSSKTGASEFPHALDLQVLDHEGLQGLREFQNEMTILAGGVVNREG